ncbi:MAG: outer membrane beta-barrel family protein [Bacteroides sp.]|nr:outer membrane beta-barrel family protein [Roseburia sp.]MCM1345937.1 outer membrane beta-barrel family protein [Bacteroides sp.]MCM1420301.1 outer membrane beta-barrel family protein [Bacteroides sp.]
MEYNIQKFPLKNKNIKRHILILLSVFFVLPLSAQKYIIYGDVRDMITDEVMTNVQVVLKDSNGQPIDTMYTGQMGQVNDTPKAWLFFLEKKAADFIVSFSQKDYEEQDITVKYRPNGRKTLYKSPSVKMKRQKEHLLDEVVVRATRVMIYTNKDTIVYNADAFQLAEGSMLDALVRQMPNVELKDDGRIFVNGKYVESLLLNGEDFFKGNNTVLLDNLPSYMVNQVKVYEKEGKLSEFAGRNMNDKEYVMDIRLKKQYSIGWIGNVEGGYGSEDRYLARLFALRFTPQSRISVFGNINNVNESRKPGNNGEWSPSNITTGQDATKNFGLDYLVKDRLKRWEINGSASFTHKDHDGTTNTSTTNFLPEGNAYERTLNAKKDCNTSFSTNHSFYIKKERTQVWLRPSLNYNRWDSQSLYADLDLTQNLFDRKELLDSMMQSVVSSSLWKYMANRSVSESIGEGRKYSGSFNVSWNQKFKNNDDIFVLNAFITHQNSKTDRYSHYLYEYDNAAASGVTSDFRNRFNQQHPDNYVSYYAKASYWIWFPRNLAIVPAYRYWGARQHQDYSTYRLDSLSQWGADSPLGMLPSVTEYLNTIDKGNSYESKKWESEHTGSIDVQWEGNAGKGYMKLKASLPVRLTTHKLDYLRAQTDTAFRHSSTFFEPKAELHYYWNNWNNELTLKYDTKASFAPMTSFAYFRSDEDPLNVTLGGSNLKDSYAHSAYFMFSKKNSDKGRFFNVNGTYTVTSNQMAYAYVYNRTTGIRTYRMENVNGNYTAELYVNYTCPLDKAKKLIFSSNTGYEFFHNADLIGEESGMTQGMFSRPSRSVVKTNVLGQAFKLRWKIGKHNLQFYTSGDWYLASGSQANFQNINAGNFKYGMTAQIELPEGIQLSNDITMYSRRGYNSNDMNTNDLVWNARLSKRLCKNRLTLIIDGFDILSQLSGTTFAINGQGQKETYRNVIPRYVMAHVVYKLNIKPKKKPGE